MHGPIAPAPKPSPPLPPKPRPARRPRPAADAASALRARRRLKLVTVGARACGKSTLIRRFCEGKFVAKYIPTIGIDYGVHKTSSPCGTYRVVLDFFDMAAGPEFLDSRRDFYVNAQALLFVYDVGDKASLAALDAFWAEAGACGAKVVKAMVLCAAKVDGRRAVPEAEGRAWAAAHGGMDYVETSAATGASVQELFEGIIGSVVKRTTWKGEGVVK